MTAVKNEFIKNTAQRVSNVTTFILRSRRLYVSLLSCNDRRLCFKREPVLC